MPRCYMLPVPPSANRWWRRARNVIYKSKDARAYNDEAEAVLRLQGWHARECVLDAEVQVEIIWWRGRRAGDLDKRLPIMLDALQGFLYLNDAQVTRIVSERIDCAPLGTPRLDVRVTVR